MLQNQSRPSIPYVANDPGARYWARARSGAARGRGGKVQQTKEGHEVEDKDLGGGKYIALKQALCEKNFVILAGPYVPTSAILKTKNVTNHLDVRR